MKKRLQQSKPFSSMTKEEKEKYPDDERKLCNESKGEKNFNFFHRFPFTIH
jgi:hypothetical protein